MDDKLPEELTDSDIVRLLRSKEYDDRRDGLHALLPEHSSILITTNGVTQDLADSRNAEPDRLQSAVLYALSQIGKSLGQVMMVGVAQDPRKKIVVAGPNPLGKLMR
jgi:hypothetical protein